MIGRLRFRFYCGFCNDEILNGHGYKLICYEYDDRAVLDASSKRLCDRCHAEIQRVLEHTLAKIRIAKLQETWGNTKQDTAEKIVIQP
jgi:hypothetical protein